jgi:synaptojanin
LWSNNKLSFVSSQILVHDFLLSSYVFWLGDLNFRLKHEGKGSLAADKIGSMVSRGEMETLLEHDQLREVMKSGEAFSELHEPPIDFAPTYKFNIHSSIYDLK